MSHNFMLRVLSSAILLSAALHSQNLKDSAPLRFWSAPLYWQPSATERFSSARMASAATASAPAPTYTFVAVTPCRVIDTRSIFGFPAPFGAPSLVANATRSFPIQASTLCSIPSTAVAYSFNVTVTPAGGGLGFLTLWPMGVPQPNASTLNNPNALSAVANAAIVPAGSDGSGSINAFASNATDMIVDINGYYTSVSDITLTQGSVTAPSMSFSGDAGTGIYSSAAGTINMSSAGTQALTVGNANDVTGLGLGALAANTTGAHNVAVGSGALGSNTIGGANTAVGHGALGANTTGSSNTALGGLSLNTNTSGNNLVALGQWVLMNNTTGGNNTAAGQAAMLNNTTGCCNAAVGQAALNGNTTGNANSALGGSALQDNTTGSGNTAVGQGALLHNTTASNNTAAGQNSLGSNTTGTNNAAFGTNALAASATGNGNSAFGAGALAASTGTENVAVGTGALGSITGGVGDIAIGWGALGTTTGGNNNIAIGTQAGMNVAGNANNIHIGNTGVSGDNNTIRIGTQGTQSAFFAAGISGATTGLSGAVPVVVDTNGQLGTVSSSARFKEDVHDMADASSGLLQLRPVTFRYKAPYQDGSKPLDYGLIAEEVAKIYPDLVVKDASGQIQTVQYQKLTPMLLNELQKEHERTQKLEERLAALEALLSAQIK